MVRPMQVSVAWGEPCLSEGSRANCKRCAPPSPGLKVRKGIGSEERKHGVLFGTSRTVTEGAVANYGCISHDYARHYRFVNRCEGTCELSLSCISESASPIL